jgi:hypothetical protein
MGLRRLLQLARDRGLSSLVCKIPYRSGGTRAYCTDPVMWSSLIPRQPKQVRLPKPRKQTLRQRDAVHVNDGEYARVTYIMVEFLTRTGQACTPLRQEFILLSVFRRLSMR